MPIGSYLSKLLPVPGTTLVNDSDPTKIVVFICTGIMHEPMSLQGRRLRRLIGRQSGGPKSRMAIVERACILNSQTETEEWISISSLMSEFSVA